MKLLKQIATYAPEYQGIKDILLANDKIIAIADQIDTSITGVEVEEIDGSGKVAVPGFIDSHFHLLGGGGENGFHNRTPEVQLSQLTTAGVTTVVGVLGTDGVGRDDMALLSKARGLETEGMTTYMYVGNYRLPVETITDSVIKDLMAIDKVIGIGEIAIADHRNGAPTFAEFAHAAADARVGGLLAGKAGVTNIHVGPGKSRLAFIKQALEETDIPVSNFYPTHCERNEELLDEAIALAKAGGVFDITGSENPDQTYELDGSIPFRQCLKRVLDEGLDPDCITMTSDGQGSLPIFDENNHFVQMGVGSSKSLLVGVKESVQRENIPLEIALRAITSAPAKLLKFTNKGQLKAGFDADLVLLDETTLSIDTVIAKGETMVEKGVAVKWGTFEQNEV
ncbi:beta-aspartyl-peptidase [Tetragenococcus koreensis]|uniref:Isoaspartyl dipeptidase n=1 Tax=Tetragenococcus koreensis TaxID=290335 RepID=A0AAN4UDP4_9ENTE|nr:beta-aspartyl-peptidase [Tetragenococcus koreensis]GEQ50536.1 isoaspartyl dipeptidase [Tetragenococcus koreensis]GEQ53041.1 isoaspartyl dipeptidase [Tetragenococcus koreensis]GEQ55544.1 isoaspartyl dipeptidase [Tetragenococcus koreensis]GEQ58041.1 isoaspartyl dipeptidase [Tetragenococcus koreensis]GEQ60538.1 isoaspartyl dipeptidase [Tetragenococcus koreensis]